MLLTELHSGNQSLKDLAKDIDASKMEFGGLQARSHTVQIEKGSSSHQAEAIQASIQVSVELASGWSQP